MVTLDRKGRILLPKRVRDLAGLNVPEVMVAFVKGEGHIELIKVDPVMRRAKEIARRKLANWKEEEHEATKFLYRLKGIKTHRRNVAS